MLSIPLKIQQSIIGHLTIDTESLLSLLTEQKACELDDLSRNLAMVIEDKKAQQYLGESFLECLLDIRL